MRIKVNDYNGNDVRMSFEAESQADGYQLMAIIEKLKNNRAAWYEWHGEEGRGIGIVIRKNIDPTVPTDEA